MENRQCFPNTPLWLDLWVFGPWFLGPGGGEEPDLLIILFSRLRPPPAARDRDCGVQRQAERGVFWACFLFYGKWFVFFLDLGFCWLFFFFPFSYFFSLSASVSVWGTLGRLEEAMCIFLTLVALLVATECCVEAGLWPLVGVLVCKLVYHLLPAATAHHRPGPSYNTGYDTVPGAYSLGQAEAMEKGRQSRANGERLREWKVDREQREGQLVVARLHIPSFLEGEASLIWPVGFSLMRWGQRLLRDRRSMLRLVAFPFPASGWMMICSRLHLSILFQGRWGGKGFCLHLPHKARLGPQVDGEGGGCMN